MDGGPDVRRGASAGNGVAVDILLQGVPTQAEAGQLQSRKSHEPDDSAQSGLACSSTSTHWRRSSTAATEERMHMFRIVCLIAAGVLLPSGAFAAETPNVRRITLEEAKTMAGGAATAADLPRLAV